MKPSRRLILHRFATAYRGLLSFNGFPMIVSGCIILAFALSMAYRFAGTLGSFGVAAVITLGIAYCIPWGVITEPVSAEEEHFQ